MSPRRILAALMLALLVSGGSTWLVSRRMARAAQPPPDARYAAPARALEAGEVLRTEDIEFVAWPAGRPLEGAYSRIADAVGREALFPLAKGQPLLDRELSAPGTGVGLASKIPDGMRAVALRSNEVVGVAGFLVPGSHLDVLVTYHASDSPEPVTATVLQNSSVIAVGHQVEPDPQGKPSDVTIVTLLLSPEETQRAVLASTQGAIHFVLRNGKDAERVANPPLLLSQLATDRLPVPRAAVRPVAAAAPVVKRREPEIETVLGGAR